MVCPATTTTTTTTIHVYSKLCLSNSYTSLSYLVPAVCDKAVINDNQIYLNIVTISSTV